MHLLYDIEKALNKLNTVRWFPQAYFKMNYPFSNIDLIPLNFNKALIFNAQCTLHTYKTAALL